MSVSIDRVKEISRAVIAQQGAPIDLLGIVSSDSDANRVEVLMTIGRASCRTLVLNVQRRDQDDFERDLRGKLHEVVHRHDR